ncbi:unnamed protein product [Amaranthus hypochondriacus]
MGGLLHLFDFHHASKRRKHKKQVTADVAAPRNSLEMPAETWRSHYADGNCQEGLPKRSYYPTDASSKSLISQDLSKQPNNKQTAPSIVAKLMGMDLLPVDAKSDVLSLRGKNDDEIEFIDKKVQLIENVSAVRTPKKPKSSRKKEFYSYKDSYLRYWRSGTNFGKARPRVHPQEKELQKFKKDFEAWQAARFLECARVVQLGNIPDQWLAQLDLTKEKMNLYETSRKDSFDKSDGHKRNMMKSRSLCGADFEHVGYKKDAFLARHKESYSFSGISPGRDLEQLYSRDSGTPAEKFSTPSQIVILKPGPDSFSTNDESWVTSTCSMNDGDCIEDLLEEVKERLKYEVQCSSFKKGSVVRGGGIETPYKEKPVRAKEINQHYQSVAKSANEKSRRDSSKKLYRSESARFDRSDGLMSELVPLSPEYVSRETRNVLTERLQNVLDGERHQDVCVSSDGSPMEQPLYDDARVRLEKARDILNAEHGKHYWHDKSYNVEMQARSSRRDPSDDVNFQEHPSPRSLVRSLSAPVSGMSFGKLLLEDRYISSGAHLKRKHEAFENLSMDVKDQNERFHLREKVSSLKHSLSLRRRLCSRKLESMDFSDSNEFNSSTDIMNGPTVTTHFNYRNENSTELPPSPASVCSTPCDDFWRRIDHPSPISVSDVTSVEDHSGGNVFREISFNLSELRKQLNQLDYEGSEITTVTEDPSELEVVEPEDEAEAYIKNLLVTSGLYDGSWVKSFSRWDPYVKPLGNWVFEKVEELYKRTTNENEATSHYYTSLEHKLLFDLLNEALTVVLKPPKTLLKFRTKLTDVTVLPFPQGRKLLEQVWEMVCEYLNPSSNLSYYTFDDLVAHDLRIMPWSSLSDEEMSTVGKELEFQIMEDLIEELLMDMQF